MSDENFLSVVSALYAGGWRSGDAALLVSYYGFEPDFAARLCEQFAEIEKTEKEIPL